VTILPLSPSRRPVIVANTILQSYEGLCHDWCNALAIYPSWLHEQAVQLTSQVIQETPSSAASWGNKIKSNERHLLNGIFFA
jgi:hypothetical protein